MRGPGEGEKEEISVSDKAQHGRASLEQHVDLISNQTGEPSIQQQTHRTWGPLSVHFIAPSNLLGRCE